MNIAIVLYGQPRDYLKGYNLIMTFIKKQTDCKFDFFYHSWKLNENDKYNHSPWRKIEENTLIYKETIPLELEKLYNPVSYEIENQTKIVFDDSLYKNTLAYNNTKSSDVLLNNINNTLFQMYSRNKARNLLKRYLENTDNKVHYDFVMTLRFDIDIMPEIKFNELNKSNVYVSNIHYPRKIIPDNCIITPTNIFLEWFNIYDMLEHILDNKTILEYIISLKETIIINPEQLILAKYIYHYKNTDNISYFQGGTI